MKIGFNARHLASPEIRGISRYTLELLKGLAGLPEVELYLFTDFPIHPNFKNIFPFKEVYFQARREILWEQWELPKKIKENKIDLFHATANRGLPYLKHCPQVLTIHDIIEKIPQFQYKGNLKSQLRTYYANFISLRAANKILTVSEASKKNICDYYKVASQKVVVIYEACDTSFYEIKSETERNKLRQKLKLPKSFLLYLGGFDKRKNLKALIEAYAQWYPKTLSLVMAGESKWDVDDLKKITSQLNLDPYIVFTGLIDEGDLATLYQCAEAFIHPSLHEGFGLQLVEAMASGLPLLCSNKTSIPEVAGESAIYFNPEDPKTIINALSSFSDLQDTQKLRKASLERAKQFSWQKAAAQTYKLYRHLSSQGVS